MPPLRTRYFPGKPTMNTPTALPPPTKGAPATAPRTAPLRFVRRGQTVTLHDVPPERTLLEVLREDLGCTAVKEGCGEGDCGACTVVLGEAQEAAQSQTPRLAYRAVNSCIRLAHSVDGLAVWTAEDIAADQPGFAFPPPSAAPLALAEASPQADAPGCLSATCGDLHPAQQALVRCHGSQCGFCTPGFAMSLFGLYQNSAEPAAITRGQAQAALSGNLCRCTGYRPILDAAHAMHAYPPQRVDEARVLALLQAIPGAPTDDAGYQRPATLAALLAARAARPQAQIVAGATDVGLWITKQHRLFPRLLDVTGARELQAFGTTGTAAAPVLRIGAAVRLEDAFAHLAATWPELRRFAERFAGLPVRNSGTLGGNVANGSPIGGSMPLLIALRAQVVLASVRGERALPLESLYTGYRRNVMAPDEILAWIDVPLPVPGAPGRPLLRAYKISKRYDDDISAVCLVLHLVLDQGRVAAVSIGAGGVAATPVRATQTEAALAGQPWSETTVHAAMQTLRGEFQPISDMRASAAYRQAVLGNLLRRFWLESQAPAGAAALSLDDGQQAFAD
ncbi:MAG: 6-hydroxypseudooxynicotine dehydrogenase complex subunit beta [Paracidovorax wautersii]|uniref:6-hydroxypseudooxynicotine dehydrogenase complex subunit beta n=1 Tax=Paracidovorax wautersii TaxID=1177982 RepID=A0A7V8FQ85_9BURK|nr:MAG: 6-hydroxypseudooxynicotine dehydrogenase complex subunit beta [Paracidovorax wautersii]